MYPVENDFRKRNYFSIPENQSITRSSSSSVASDITNSSEDNDVESFLITLYTQQIKEKNISIVKSRTGMMRGSRVDTPVVPIISSAVNIRDYYVRQLQSMK